MANPNSMENTTVASVIKSTIPRAQTYVQTNFVAQSQTKQIINHIIIGGVVCHAIHNKNYCGLVIACVSPYIYIGYQIVNNCSIDNVIETIAKIRHAITG